MAQNTVVHFSSDLSGDPIEGDSPTVRFGLDGTEYEIDLTDEEALALRDALAEYTANGRRNRGAVSRGSASKRTTSNAAQVREWAESNGYEVPARGRIPKEIHDAYSAAN